MSDDMVNRPKHYQSPFGIKINLNDIMHNDNDPGSSVVKIYIQALDVIKAWGLQNDFYLANVVKYILRSDKKGATLQDLKKARFYLDEKIAEMEAQNDAR